MILTVTPNPAIDVTIASGPIELGASHVVGTGVRRAGGKGLNVARALAQQGVPVAATALVGAGDAEWFAADLGAPFLPVACAGPTRASYAVHEVRSGRVTMLNERGPAREDAAWRELARVVAAHPGADAVAISGSLPPDPPPGALAAVVAAGRAGGSVVIADLVGDALLDAIDAGSQIVKPNRDELRRTTGAEDPLDGAAALLRRGAELVVVSLGEDGILAVSAREPRGILARLGAPLVGNPTGAGDAAVAALAASVADGFALGDALEAPLRRAVAWSAAAVLEPLAGSIHPRHTELARGVVVTAL